MKADAHVCCSSDSQGLREGGYRGTAYPRKFASKGARERSEGPGRPADVIRNIFLKIGLKFSHFDAILGLYEVL